MSKGSVTLCGTPRDSCTGVHYLTDQHLPTKCHHDPFEAFKCYARYLKSQGYKQIGPREFSPPDGGPVLVLTKKSRYGGRLRQGKRADKSSGSSRYMPHGRRTQGVVF